jgi:hypothetical protein
MWDHDHGAWLVGTYCPLWKVQETNWLMRKTEVIHKCSRAFTMGDMPIKGITRHMSKPVSLSVSQSISAVWLSQEKSGVSSGTAVKK